VRILHLLGIEGPKTSQPTKYIRYIYNRVVLENAVVRAAAVTALAKFGVGQKDPEVKRSVSVLLTRCLDDVDDEVRDRAALNLRLMTEPDELADRFIKNESMFTLPYFEHQLVMYVTAEDKSTFDTPFDISSIPVVTKEQADAEDRTKKLTTVTPTLKAPKSGSAKSAPATGAEAIASASAAAQKYSQQLLAIPEMKSYGNVLKSSPVVELTESETEYVVSVIKHIFKEHIVLQYEVKNTLPDTVLEAVSVVATPSDEEELEEDFIIPAPKLATDEPGTIYVSFKKIATEGFPASTFTNVLKFTTKEIDPTTGEPEESGYDDEYQVEDLELTGSDYVVPAFAGNFSHIWEQVGANGEEAEETLQLSGVKSIAGMLILNIFIIIIANLARCDRTTRKNTIVTAFGRYRCSRKHHHPYSQVVWKDRHWWKSGCQHSDGILHKVWSHVKNNRSQRGRRCCSSGHRVRCLG